MLAKSHRDLDVNKVAFEAALEICEITRAFPNEKYSLTDQIRRSSRYAPTSIIWALS